MPYFFRVAAAIGCIPFLASLGSSIGRVFYLLASALSQGAY